MNWDDLRLLLSVARRGSFLQAGDALGMAASTISRRITQLEAAIGEPLVERAADGSRLTSRAMALIEAAQQMETELTRSNSSNGLHGLVRVSAGEGFIEAVNSAIAAFINLNPACQVDFTISDDLLKIARSATDIAIRTVHLGEPSLIYQKLRAIEFGIFASPDYATQLPSRPHPNDAAMIDLLPPLDQLAHLRVARAVGFSVTRFRVSSFSAQAAAVRSGYGMAVLPRVLAKGLVEPFGAINLPSLEIFLTTRPNALRQPHIRSFVDILRRKIIHQADYSEFQEPDPA